MTLVQVLSLCVFLNFRYSSKYSAQIYRAQYGAAMLVYLRGTPTWRPEDSVNICIKALRCIDEAGGFDNYIINTHERTLDSKLAINLKKLMISVLKCKEEGESDQREEVFPKPPPSRHIYVPKVYTDIFYFDWKGPRMQMIFC